MSEDGKQDPKQDTAPETPDSEDEHRPETGDTAHGEDPDDGGEDLDDGGEDSDDDEDDEDDEDSGGGEDSDDDEDDEDPGESGKRPDQDSEQPVGDRPGEVDRAALPRGEVPVSLAKGVRKLDPLTLAVAVVLVVGGWGFARNVSEAVQVTAFDGDLQVELPEGWMTLEDGDVFQAYSPEIASYASQLRVRRITLLQERPREIPSLIDRETVARTVRRSQHLEAALATIEDEPLDGGLGHRAQERREDRPAFGGHEATWLYYTVASTADEASEGGTGSGPALAGIDVVVATGGGTGYRVSVLTTAGNLDAIVDAVLRPLTIAR